MNKLILGVCIMTLLSCQSTEVRMPAQTEVPLAQRMNFVNLSSFVTVPHLSLTREGLAPYINQCHIQMVEKILDFSERLQKVKDFSGKNIQIGPLRRTVMDSMTSKVGYTSWNFKFTLMDSNRTKYYGHIYTESKNDLPLIFRHPNGTYEYQCWAAHDGWVFNAAELKDAKGTKVFSSSCAQRMLNGEKIDERCNPIN